MLTEQTTAPNCPFCLDNGLLKGEILAQTAQAFVITPADNPNCYLIIPTRHAESISDLPDEWWKYFTEIFKEISSIPGDFNISLNCGKAAGQSVRHLHFWIIARSDTDKAAGKGLARLISETNQE